VVGVADERFGERVVAIVQPRTGRIVDSESLRLHCHERLTGFKVPTKILLVDEIGRSPSGKPDYPQARALAEAAIDRT
jgi:acyl-CoA synthetase (AMP-forming)/AMP-acid ligase II